MPPKIQIFTFLFLMLGPFKIIGPFGAVVIAIMTLNLITMLITRHI
jgi:hypothetical protein